MKNNMANVNLENGLITGAIEGTKRYYHEEGHLKFEEYSDHGNRIRVIQDLSLRFLIFTLAFELIFSWIYFKWMIIIFILLNIFSEMYEEIWCWKFSFNKSKLNQEKEDDRERIQN